jgi:hypothetical protein
LVAIVDKWLHHEGLLSAVAEKLEISCKQEVFHGLSLKQQELTESSTTWGWHGSNKLKFMDEVDNMVAETAFLFTELPKHLREIQMIREICDWYF